MHLHSKFAGAVAIGLLCCSIYPANAVTFDEALERLQLPQTPDLPSTLMTRQDMLRVLETLGLPGGQQPSSNPNSPGVPDPFTVAPGVIYGMTESFPNRTYDIARQIEAIEMAVAAYTNPLSGSGYNYYTAGYFTPKPVTAKGTYNGVLRGQTEGGTALTGKVRFDVDVAPTSANISGTFAFDGADTLTLSNVYHAGAYGVYVNSYQDFMGGNVDYMEHMDTRFYGPNAEQYGGEWAFRVSGGTAPGVVSGDFVSKR